MSNLIPLTTVAHILTETISIELSDAYKRVSNAVAESDIQLGGITRSACVSSTVAKTVIDRLATKHLVDIGELPHDSLS